MTVLSMSTRALVKFPLEGLCFLHVPFVIDDDMCGDNNLFEQFKADVQGKLKVESKLVIQLNPITHPTSKSPTMEARSMCDVYKIAHDLLYLGNEKEALHPKLVISMAPINASDDIQLELFRFDLCLDVNKRKQSDRLLFIGYNSEMVKLPIANPTEFVCVMRVEFNIDSYVKLSKILEPFEEKMSRILKEKKHCDFILTSMDGTEFPCHKVFLAGSSARLAAAVSTSFTEGQEGKLSMDEMSSESVEAFLEYIYCNSVFAPCGEAVIAFELLKASDFYDLPQLWTALAKMMQGKRANWFDVDVAINVYDFVKKKDDKSESGQLKRKMIEVLSEKRAELDESPVFQRIFPDDVSRDLFKSALEGYKK